MAVVLVEVLGEDASEIAASLEHLLRGVCLPGLAVFETPDRAVLSCEVLSLEGSTDEVEDRAAEVLGDDRREAERFR